ncbi:hypothetical protein Hypma_013683 [Hypsizygus marmoreus]|uniref:DUF6699 domain-containing protein n=1 Tax=Hypsizygus marmoreus TaxID=39966 RepID=A0A369JDQ2_HYPMA|nr:hypothetical protein Hypma_013683 [Hypsizygus marmoreus]
MSSHHGTPFIPPLNTPQGSPHPPHPPVIPSPGGTTIVPPWGQAAVHSSSYPAYPTTPYTTPGYIPNLPPVTPGGPHYSQAVLSTPQPQVLPNGFSADYTGYPNLGPPRPSPMAGPSLSLHPPAPMYGPTSAPPGGGWGGPPRGPYPPFGPPPPQQPPHSAFPGYGAYTPHSGQWGPPPQLPPHMTPGYGMPMNLDPWGPPPPAPTWVQQAQAQAQPQAMYSQPPAPHMNLPQHLMGGRTSGYVGDRVDPFTAGPSYGPVLEPFLVRVVGAHLKVNPLIEPLPESGDRPHLKWNMLFQSNHCQRSTDPGHVSWANGRDEPATFPRVTAVNIVSQTVPWVMRLQARDPNVGLTCGELIDGLSDEFQKLTSQADYEALSTTRRREVGEAYRHNRSRSIGTPGGRLGEGLRRLDFLGRDSVFGGIVNDERLYMLTEEEHNNHESRERAASQARERASSRGSQAADERERRRATVETVTTDSGEEE